MPVGGKGCQETEKALLIVYCVGEGVEVYGHLRRLTAKVSGWP